MRRLTVAVLMLAASLPVHAAHADCSSEVQAAIEKQAQQKAFRKVTNLITENGPVKMTVDYQMPDRMRQEVQFTTDPKPFLTILVGDKAWTNQGDGWVVATDDEASQLASYFRQTAGVVPQDVGQFECAGTESFEGREVRAYRGLPPKSPFQPKDDPEKKLVTPGGENQAVRLIFLDTGSGLPVRSIYAAPGMLESPVFQEIYSYPAELAIEGPKDAKPAPQPEAGVPGAPDKPATTR